MVGNTLRKRAGELGLTLDAPSGLYYGTLNGYHVTVIPENVKNRFDILFSVRRFGIDPAPTDFQPLEKGCAVISSIQVLGRRVTMTTKPHQWSDKKAIDELRQAIGEALNYLLLNQFTDCCQGCGREDSVASIYLGGSASHFCPDCYSAAVRQTRQNRENERIKTESPVAGAVGALLGSLVGGLAIIAFSQLNLISALSGVIMAICTLKGYELLGGKNSTRGIVISCLMMALMVYLSDRADWAIVVVKELKLDFFEAFRAVPALIRETDLTSTYYGNLAMVYLFTGLGAFLGIRDYRRKKTVLPNLVYPLGTNPNP